MEEAIKAVIQERPDLFLLVLRVLVNHQVKPITTKLVRMVWGLDYNEEMDILRVIIRQRGTKIERDPAHPRYILIEPWFGHRFQIPSDPSENLGVQNGSVSAPDEPRRDRDSIPTH
jgi:hypothetical protein